MKKSRFLAVALVMLLGGSIAAAATIVEVGPSTTLGVLADGQSLQVGDKLFYDFSWTTSVENVTEGIPGPGIVVTPVQEGGNYGLRFNAGWTAGPNQIVDTTIRFRVRALDELLYVHDALLMMSAFGTFGSGQAAVTENIYPVDALGAVGQTPLANLYVFRNAWFTKNADNALFDLSKEVYVVKDIVVRGTDAGTSSASISEVIQIFSQAPIPEPASLSLLGLGALALIRRRR